MREIPNILAKLLSPPRCGSLGFTPLDSVTSYLLFKDSNPSHFIFRVLSRPEFFTKPKLLQKIHFLWRNFLIYYNISDFVWEIWSQTFLSFLIIIVFGMSSGIAPNELKFEAKYIILTLWYQMLRISNLYFSILGIQRVKSLRFNQDIHKTI